jgi:hypothetical protein
MHLNNNWRKWQSRDVRDTPPAMTQINERDCYAPLWRNQMTTFVSIWRAASPGTRCLADPTRQHSRNHGPENLQPNMASTGSNITFILTPTPRRRTHWMKAIHSLSTDRLNDWSADSSVVVAKLAIRYTWVASITLRPLHPKSLTEIQQEWLFPEDIWRNGYRTKKKLKCPWFAP